MEGLLVLGGLAAVGLLNKNNNFNNDLESNPANPSMNNIYNSTYMNDVKQNEKEFYTLYLKLDSSSKCNIV